MVNFDASMFDAHSQQIMKSFLNQGLTKESDMQSNKYFK